MSINSVYRKGALYKENNKIIGSFDNALREGCAFSKNIDEVEEIGDNKVLEKVHSLLESELENDNTGVAAGMLDEIYSGKFGDISEEGSQYWKFFDSLNITFEDRMKLSEKYLIISIEKEMVRVGRFI